MKPMVTVFERSPDRGRGLARDMRVRWALEEVGQPYEVRGVSFDDMKRPAHRARHPFGQIPTYEEGGLRLFESGAIVLHIAERHPGLLPVESQGRARAIAWMFAAVSTLEPPIVNLETARREDRDQPWYAQRMHPLEQTVQGRLVELSTALAAREWLDNEFTAGDLMMVSVLLRLKETHDLDHHPSLVAYLARGETRAAYQRAFAAQRALFLDACR